MRIPVAVIATAVLAAVAFGTWRVRDLWWDEVFGDSVEAEPLPAGFAPPRGAPLHRRLPADGPGARTAAAGVPAVPPSGPTPGGDAAAVSRPADPTLPPPAASEASAPPVLPILPAVSEIREIRARSIPAGTEIEIVGDGVIRSANFAHFRLEAGAPRELIKVKGIRRPFATQRSEPATAELSSIRTGFHAPDEVHVVLDLADREVALTAIEADGARLIVRLERRSP